MKKILVDVDGVLLDWEPAFDAWMSQKGFKVKQAGVYDQYIRYGFQTKNQCNELVKQFNESAWMGFLKPLRDSVEYVHKLKAQGYHFEAITSLSTDHWAKELRTMNLERWFGRGTFYRVQCLDTGADKDEVLKQFEPGHWWIEDKPANAEAGLRAGHKTILVSHTWNLDYKNNDIIRADNWQEIYNIITAL